MKIVIKTKNLTLDQNLAKFIDEKINSLEKFLDNEKDYCGDFWERGKPKIEAWVEVGKTTLHHQKGPFFFAECQIKLPRKSLRAVAEGKYIKLAIVEVKDELQEQLKKYKSKKHDFRLR